MAKPRINGKTSPFVRSGFFACEICDECFPRRSNAQKYCDGCRQLAISKKVSAYYRKHRKKILKEKHSYRVANRDLIN